MAKAFVPRWVSWPIKKEFRMRRYSIAVLLLVFPLWLMAQGGKLKKANDSYAAGEWLKAIEQYRDAYEVVEDKNKKTEIIFYIAECYRHLRDPVHAELWYKKTITREYQNPLIYLYYADALRAQGKYKEAEPMYRRYKELVPDDPRGENGIQSCQLAQRWIDNPNGYIVENLKDVNSRASDVCPAFGRGDYMVLYFASNRNGSKGTVREGTGELPYDIYVTKLDKQGRWSTPVPISGEINTEFEEGTPSINSNYTVMYYTSCRPIKGKKASSQIMVAQLSGESFSKGEVLDLAGDSVDVLHPAISPDEQTLYFAADMPGGIGGYDIWKVTKNGDEWGKPVNLGPTVNTPGNELFPYVHPDGTLYFSSDGHIGLGGLDIFKAKPQPDGTWQVENMRYPINSNADDFGIVFQANEEKGFLTSNRGGNDDIYIFVLPPLRFTIAGRVIDDRTEKPIADATVKSIGSDGITTETRTGKEGDFQFNLKPNTDYVFVALKEGYLNNKARVTTKGEQRSRDFKTSINLTPIDRPIEIPDIVYDFASAALRPESKAALDKLVETLNDNPNVTILLMANTDYIGNEKANLELSQRRAQSVVDYLIEKGIAPDRLVAKGNGESEPKMVDEKINRQYPFLPVGTVLTESFIKTLTPDQQEFANQINRRTEFKVLRTDYVPKK
jgi:peptidoglycan-associated lipoprotein